MSTYRRRFTEADFDFVASALAPGGTRCHLEKLWNDADGIREILDLKEVLRSLIERPVTLPVSPKFYFYVLVRHAFLGAELRDVGMADYISSVMAKRVDGDVCDPLQDVTRGFTHAAEFLSFISSSKGRMRFHLQVAAGNQFLILTGLYPEFLRRRFIDGVAPDLEFYESFAQHAYRGAASHRLAQASASSQFFSELAEALPVARRSLNRVAEEFVFLGE